MRISSFKANDIDLGNLSLRSKKGPKRANRPILRFDGQGNFLV